MALRDKLRDRAAPYLQAGEQIQAVIPAQAASPYFAILSVWIVVAMNAYRVVVVTDRRILVCQAGRMSIATLKGVRRELPRATRIGPPSGLWYRTDALGEHLYINRRFHKDVEAADQGSTAA